MNWYKQAQINGGEVKYHLDGSFFILGKNTKQGEGPWRISFFDDRGKGYTHQDFKTYEDAKSIFDITYGTLQSPKKKDYELV